MTVDKNDFVLKIFWCLKFKSAPIVYDLLQFSWEIGNTEPFWGEIVSWLQIVGDKYLQIAEKLIFIAQTQHINKSEGRFCNSDPAMNHSSLFQLF